MFMHTGLLSDAYQNAASARSRALGTGDVAISMDNWGPGALTGGYAAAAAEHQRRAPTQFNHFSTGRMDNGILADVLEQRQALTQKQMQQRMSDQGGKPAQQQAVGPASLRGNMSMMGPDNAQNPNILSLLGNRIGAMR